jgi:hypothetical protein
MFRKSAVTTDADRHDIWWTMDHHRDIMGEFRDNAAPARPPGKA